MKTKRIHYTLCGVAVMAVATFVAYTEFHNHRQMSELTRRNLAALLEDGEGGDRYIFDCQEASVVILCQYQCPLCRYFFQIPKGGPAANVRGKCSNCKFDPSVVK